MSIDLTLYNDYWGDPFSATNGIMRGGVYYYYLNKELVQAIIDNQAKKYNMALIPPVQAIQSVNLAPYLWGDDLTFAAMEFDQARMPFADSQWAPEVNPYVFRIKNVVAPKKQVGVIVRYHNKPNLGDKRNYKYESKLQMYPYSYGLLTDGISEPIMIKMENFNHSKNGVAVYLYQPLSNQGTYAFWVYGYKGDIGGAYQGDIGGYIEGSVSKRAFNLPIVNNAYANFMSQQQASFRQGITNAGVNAMSGAIIGTMNGANSGPIGLITGSMNGMINGATSAYTQVQSALAQRRDLLSTPNALSNAGSDVLFYQHFNSTYLTFYRYGIKQEYQKRIGEYFALFGYKQNKLMAINQRSRYYYNFVKVHELNIKGANVPKEHLEKIKQIYEKGCTFWHVDRPSVTCLDRTYDNKETYGKIL